MEKRGREILRKMENERNGEKKKRENGGKERKRENLRKGEKQII